MSTNTDYASLWSHQAGSRHQTMPSAVLNGVCLILLVAVLHIEVSSVEGLLGSSNGRVVSFLKSLHMTNYYYVRSRYTSRSVVGCMVLKFIGSTIISVALGEGLLIASPRHLLSFLWAFSLVRSDSVEATQLSRHMRHSLAFNVLLNLIAALCESLPRTRASLRGEPPLQTCVAHCAAQTSSESSSSSRARRRRSGCRPPSSSEPSPSPPPPR